MSQMSSAESADSKAALSIEGDFLRREVAFNIFAFTAKKNWGQKKNCGQSAYTRTIHTVEVG
jgi:hypothetical protein